jgi:hypothetical protein
LNASSTLRDGPMLTTFVAAVALGAKTSRRRATANAA